MWFIGRRSGPGEFLDLRIRNFSQVDIVVRGIRAIPSRRWVAQDSSERGVIKAVMKKTFVDVIAPSNEANFPIIKAPDRANWFPFTVFFVSWRKASSLWLPQIPCITWSSEKWLAILAQPSGDR